MPVDIKDICPKAQETFSLKTKGYQEVLKRVRGGKPRDRLEDR